MMLCCNANNNNNEASMNIDAIKEDPAFPSMVFDTTTFPTKPIAYRIVNRKAR
jgi:hypothetical protein